MEREVLAARKRVFGDDHPYTLTVQSNLALTLVGALTHTLSMFTTCARIFIDNVPAPVLVPTLKELHHNSP
jgi:hypothetical protein